MAGALRVVDDVERARWLQSALANDATVASAVPAGLAAAACVRHPVMVSSRDGERRPITWREAGALIGHDVGEATSWTWTVGHDRLDLPDGRRIVPPHDGDVPLGLLGTLASIVLAESGDVDVLAAVWEGAGLSSSGTGAFEVQGAGDEPRWSAEEVRTRAAVATARLRAAIDASIDPRVRSAMERGRLLGLPESGMGRGHVLLEGRLSTFADEGWVETTGLGWRAGPDDLPRDTGRTPNALWPAWLGPDGLEREDAWMLACDMDADATIVAGAPRLVGAVLAHPGLEAIRVLPSTPIA